MFFKDQSSPSTPNIISSIMMNEFPSPTSSSAPGSTNNNSSNAMGLLMTPNTIKTIEQSILASLESASASSGQGGSSTYHQMNIIPSTATGSFVPPLPQQQQQQQQQPTFNIVANNWQGVNQMITKVEPSENSNYNSNDDSYISEEEDRKVYKNNSSDEDEDEQIKKRVTKRKAAPAKKSSGGGRRGRRSTKSNEYSDDGGDGQGGDDSNRRKIRRERNKLAAARCRKRRVDHTNQLVEETESLESTRSRLQHQITLYQQKKEELEFLLQAHLPSCSKQNKQPQLVAVSTTTQSVIRQPPAKRPTTLPVAMTTTPTTSGSLGGISISTPSNGLNIIGGFENIDWSDLPSTGLTPTVTQINSVGLTTPLVTPGTVREILGSLNASSGSSQNSNNKFFSL